MASVTASEYLTPVELKCEYLINPMGIESFHPRLSWKVISAARGQRQTAYRILVASSRELLKLEKGDYWDTGKVLSDETVNLPYNGRKFKSGDRIFWSVKCWDAQGVASKWSEPAKWSMGLLSPSDWKAKWISYRDTTPLHTDRNSLYLPPARYYRKELPLDKIVRRATLYVSSLGINRVEINGVKVNNTFFAPGWSDYAKRAYYRTYDVTNLLEPGPNAVCATVAEGWYSGYVGYGLLVGYGPKKVGRYFYGKTPALLAQLELEFVDGSKRTVITDPSWKVSSDGPLREADIIMGETFDNRKSINWTNPYLEEGWKWEPAILAEENGSTLATFSDNRGNRQVDLGFHKPPVMQSYCAPPVVKRYNLAVKKITIPRPGVYIFDFGQNFAGTVLFHAKGPSGTKITLRYGEMLHNDGTLMTENLRRARATDYFILKGDPNGESYTSQMTYHGFQYVEVTGLPNKPVKDSAGGSELQSWNDTMTGYVVGSNVATAGEFACSDEVMTRFWANTVWTQAANFVELPTDCPQRDERLGWMGDAQVYARTATYNADCAAFYTKWLDDVEEAQLPSGAYPDYCPYPMGHGAPNQNFGTAWTDAGIICPWTVFKVYGDTEVIKRHWKSLTRFMDWRKSVSKDFLGTELGNSWGDWLNAGETTSIRYIDTCYFAYDCQLMSEMAAAAGKKVEAAEYRLLREKIIAAFQAKYLLADGSLTETSQTAYALAITMDLLPKTVVTKSAAILAAKIRAKGIKMTTGFLGTARILPALTEAGYHDLAVQLFQSRDYPSWGYEVMNGATTVWERWDSYTKEHAFNGEKGGNNAAMNSFSHYSFGAVMEWGFKSLAGIDSDGAGYKRITIRPGIVNGNRNTKVKPIEWVTAGYNSVRGPISVRWRKFKTNYVCEVEVPANTTAKVILPSPKADAITESGKALTISRGIVAVKKEMGNTVVTIGSGRYIFTGGISPNFGGSQ